MDHCKMNPERAAVLSSCCGFTGEAVLSESAVIMVYAGMLGGDEALRLATTAVFPFLSGVLMLPFSYVALRLGPRRLTVTATLLAWLAYLCIPFVGMAPGIKVPLLVGLLIFFSASLSGFVVGWFPLLDSFLKPERRTAFIGTMRFCHQSCAAVFLLMAGWWLGNAPSLRRLQLLILVAGILFLGRALFILLIPQPAQAGRPPSRSWAAGIADAFMAPLLRRGACYIFLVNLASYGMAPLWVLYLQRSGAAESHLVYLSVASLVGMMTGYWLAGRLNASPLNALPRLQAGLLIVTLMLFFLPPSGTGLLFAVALLLLGLHNLLVALTSVEATALMMDAATSGNKTIAMALFGALGNTGIGLSRLLVAMLIHGTFMICSEKNSLPFFIGMGGACILLAIAFALRPAKKLCASQ